MGNQTVDSPNGLL